MNSATRGGFAVSALLLAAAFWPLLPPGAAIAAPAACRGERDFSLPSGFCATVFADKLGHARHLAVAPNGVVYVNTWSGSYFGNERPPAGGFLVALKDTKGEGRADVVTRFGPGAASGNDGGTGIAVFEGAVYAETNDKIVRYKLPADGIAPAGPAEVVVSGLPLTGDHPMHPFIIDAEGGLYIDLGSATNACQSQNRIAGSKGIDPCTELERRAGTWRYDARKIGQRFSSAERFVTGLRNGEGFGIDAEGHLFATQHGRDQLSQDWPKLFTPQQGAEQPAEELVQLERGADFGWPYCYYDLSQQKLLLAPEYGGDGKQVGRCADKRAPVAAFPGHWAPNAMTIYLGQQFPEAYRGGAFIAFHGSWNRAPLPQGGYNVVFQPLKDGKASGPYVIFADGFAGGRKEPGAARHRPSGVAVGPDGSLYIADDQRGRIWRVTYQGSATAAIEAAPSAAAAGAGPSSAALPPEGIHPNAGAEASLKAPPPPGATADDVVLGGRLYRDEVGIAACAGCHGSDGTGTPLGPDLTSGKWRWGDGSLDAISHTITEGVAEPKDYRSPMPPFGGSELKPEEVKAMAAYIWTLSHKSAAN